MRTLPPVACGVAVLFAVACADTTAPQNDVSIPGPSFDFANSGNPNSAVFIDPLGCTFFDGDGGLVFVNDGSALITSSGQGKLQCSAKGVPNSTGRAVTYDTDNNPFGPGVLCGMPGDPDGTAKWHETVSASGNAKLTCQNDGVQPPPPPPPPPPPDEEAPVISGLQPPDETPLFVWNPDLGVDYTGSPAVIDATRLCPSTDAVNDCESLMFEAVDLGTGVEEVGCELAYPNACDDANGDGNFIVAGIVNGPATCDGGAGCDDELLITDDAGTAGNGMFQAYFCDGPNVDAPNCDGTDDGVYTVRVLASDQASPQNNVATVDYPFVLDTYPPIIGFGFLSGLNASNAPSVQFVLTASVVDRNGDGTAVTLAEVQVSIEDRTLITGLADGDCTTVGDQLFTPAEVLVTPDDDTTDMEIKVDVTSQVNANGGDFSVTFTASNQTGGILSGAGDYTYCFELTGDDGAARKDGSDDGLAVSAVAAKDFVWQ